MGLIDTFRLLELHTRPILWPGGGGYVPVEVRINGVGLIDRIREVQLPFAEMEYDRRVQAGESPTELGPRGSLAGNYLYLPGNEVFLPSRNYLGQPFDHGFDCGADDSRTGKSLILMCTCGVTECWFLLCRIEEQGNEVVWSDFCQFHRDWTYDIGPFRFDRELYLAELSKGQMSPSPR